MESPATKVEPSKGYGVSFLLDTDICSAHIKGDRRLWQKMLQHGGALSVSVVTVGELFTWAERRGASPTRRLAIRELLQNVAIIDATSTIAERFGALRAGFLDVGRSPPEMDLLIAATALVHDLTVVTHNVQDFADIPGLRVQDWLAP
jgi:predicted nucleic acid-binding protein